MLQFIAEFVLVFAWNTLLAIVLIKNSKSYDKKCKNEKNATYTIISKVFAFDFHLKISNLQWRDLRTAMAYFITTATSENPQEVAQRGQITCSQWLVHITSKHSCQIWWYHIDDVTIYALVLTIFDMKNLHYNLYFGTLKG